MRETTTALRESSQRLARLLFVHRVFVGVLLVGAAFRALIAAAYWPALMTPDSWGYLNMAYTGHPVAAAPYPPSGYPLALRVLSVFGRSLGAIVTAQHVAGLIVGALVYLLLLRTGAPRWVAGVAAGVVLLNAPVAVLEQQIMSETFFSLAVVGSAVLLITQRRPWLVGLSAVLIAYAATLRTAGLFLIPVWIAYLLARNRDRRVLLCAALSLAAPLIVYASWYHQTVGTFGLTQSDGWFLYGRVAAFADCRHDGVPKEARTLCDSSALPPNRRTPGDFVWDPSSPARRQYDMFDTNLARRRHGNAVLRSFAVAVITHHPTSYAAAVWSDFRRFFTETRPIKPDPHFWDGLSPPERRYIDQLRTKWFPAYRNPVHTPAVTGFLEDLLSIPPLLIGLAGLCGVAAGVAWCRRAWRRALVHAPEAVLVSSLGFALLIGSAAFSEWQSRFVPSVTALFVAGGGIVAADLITAARSSRRPSETQVSPDRPEILSAGAPAVGGPEEVGAPASR